MIGSVISVFVISPIVSNGKMKMEHLLNSLFVGGIIIGGCCTICSSAWAAILIGFFGGCISVFGLWFFKKKLKELKLEDTFGILYTFGIPGILGGFLNSIFIANLENIFKNNYFLNTFFNFKLAENNNIGRNNSVQIGIEIAIIFITIAIAGFSGMTIGFIIRSFKCEKNEIYFVDSENYVEEENIPLPEWKHPRQDDINLNSSGNKL
jgi:ammonia channel protein AmtB